MGFSIRGLLRMRGRVRLPEHPFKGVWYMISAHDARQNENLNTFLYTYDWIAQNGAANIGIYDTMSSGGFLPPTNGGSTLIKSARFSRYGTIDAVMEFLGRDNQALFRTTFFDPDLVETGMSPGYPAIISTSGKSYGFYDTDSGNLIREMYYAPQSARAVDGPPVPVDATTQPYLPESRPVAGGIRG